MQLKQGQHIIAQSEAFGAPLQLFDLNILNSVMFCYMSQDKKRKKVRLSLISFLFLGPSTVE